MAKYERLRRKLEREDMRMNNSRNDYHYSHDFRNDYDQNRRDYNDTRFNDYRSDFRNDYNDYRRNDYRDYKSGYMNDYQADYGSKDLDKEYEEDLHRWIRKLEEKDTFKMTKEQVINHARSLGAKLNNYSDLELYAMYLAMESDLKRFFNDPSIFIKSAIGFLEDDDVKETGSDKLCAYLYEIVM